MKAEEVPSGTTPKEYVRGLWDISADLTLTQLYGGIPRGVTFMGKDSDKVHGIGKEKVVLTKDTVPPHEHHSGITSGSSIQTMKVSANGNFQPAINEIPYDMFKNDAVAVGLDKNELEGVVDEFVVRPEG